MNTFHLNPELGKISSPIRVMIGDQELTFSSGQELVAHSFEKPYIVSSIEAVENEIVLNLVEKSMTPTSIGSGEEQTSFF